MRFLFLFIFSSIIHLSFAQKSKTIDSLQLLIKNTTSDAIKVNQQIVLASMQSQIQPAFSKKIFNEALLIVQKKDYKFENKYQKEALIYDYLGVIARRSTDYEQTLTYYLKGLKIREQQKDSTNLGRSYHNIAMLFNTQNDYKKAEFYMNKALPLRHQFNDSVQYAKTLNMYGRFKYKLKDVDSALYFYQKAKRFFNTNLRIADVNNSLARLYTDTGKHKKALAIYEENLSIFKKHNLLERTAVALELLARINRKLDHNNLAMQHLDQSEKIAKQLGNKKLLYGIYLERYKIAEKQGDLKNALKYYQTYRKHKDTVFNLKKVNKIKDLELNYIFEKEKFAENLKFKTQKQKLLSETKIERTQKWLYILLFITTILGLIGFSFFYKYKRKLSIENSKKEQLEKQLLIERLNNLDQYSDHLMSDNKMRLQFKKELLEKIKFMKTKINVNSIKEYQSLIIDLQSQINSEKRLDSYLDANIKKDLNFEKQLYKTYPDLTKNEIDICTLIRLNLTNKEIMITRNTTIASMKSVRFRIRKKLNVPKGEELEIFIQHLF